MVRSRSCVLLLTAGLLLAGCDSGSGAPDAGADVGPGDTGLPACAAGEMRCDGACVATETDHANCGTCGNACAEAEVCLAGVCAAPPPFEVTSTAFVNGGAIPLAQLCPPFQGPGENISPPLTWTAGPAGTRSYAVVMSNRDFGWVNWVLYDIPATVMALPANIPDVEEPPEPVGSRQVLIAAASGTYGYFGPCQVPNASYSVEVHALDVETLPPVTITDPDLEAEEYAQAIEAHSIARASLVGLDTITGR